VPSCGSGSWPACKASVPSPRFRCASAMIQFSPVLPLQVLTMCPAPRHYPNVIEYSDLRTELQVGVRPTALCPCYTIDYMATYQFRRCPESAASRSAMRSSTSSMPIETRIRSDVIPCVRAQPDRTDEWVMVTGMLDQRFPPPSDSASVKTCTLSSSPKTASCPPRRRNETSRKSRSSDAGPERAADAIRGPEPHFAHLRPRFEPARNRQCVAVVLLHPDGERLDAAQHQEAVLRSGHRNRSRSVESRSSPPARAVGNDGAANHVEWPLMYFVVECTTMSTPSSSGR